ncbi:acyl carrier protein [Saccharothrix coeruleofusca]|uniref:Carrier domain-containing protein n=1 Tax=Saccharothrix coeruleofusca TaxID=33919 RepID=A0A918AS96_9PSEU|nr:acyl carrier protein [Saccharothrix coeruleofusca]MBP2335999.1 acyl carrier protein [Saccharothrix coeruleofusca]GGP76092.1 hypothetical protein GCM10010185_57170 [Saccharothrix coeruleofusca]
MSGTKQVVSYDEVHQQVREYVLGLVGVSELDGDRELITEHVVDSVAAIQMVDFVERTFGIEVEDEDLELANFNTVNGLTRLVAEKLRLS